MDTAHDDLQELRTVVRSFATELTDQGRLRARLGADRPDAEGWQRLVRELQLQGAHLPAEVGGGDAGLALAAMVVEELGSRLAPLPYLSTAAASTVLAGLPGSSTATADTLRATASGDRTLSLCLTGADAAWDPARTPGRARSEAGRVVIDGDFAFVLDGMAADTLVVLAVDATDTLGWYLVDPGSPGVERAPLPDVDLTRATAGVALRAAPAILAATADRDEVRQQLADVQLLIAAEAVGVAEQCLKLAVDYAQIRTQFDRPIGSFQAIKHLLAERYLHTLRARAALRRGLRVTGDDRVVAAAVAKLVATGAASDGATALIHVHGGTGFTWEHDAHLYRRRALSLETWLGSRRQYRRTLAGLLAS